MVNIYDYIESRMWFMVHRLLNSEYPGKTTVLSQASATFHTHLEPGLNSEALAVMRGSKQLVHNALYCSAIGTALSLLGTKKPVNISSIKHHYPDISQTQNHCAQYSD